MKKILLPGVLAGIAMLVVGMLISQLINMIFPALIAEYKTTLFRPWSDPIMSLYFLYPFILGLALAWIWDKIKGVISGTIVQRAGYLTLGYFLVSTIPGMLISYSSFPLSLTMIISWTISGVAQAFCAGLILAKMNA